MAADGISSQVAAGAEQKQMELTSKTRLNTFSASVQRGLVKSDEVGEVHFGDEGFRIDKVLAVGWAHVAAADISVRDRGRRIELSLVSADHAVFDWARVELPMSPEAAALLQIIQTKVPLETVPAVLLKQPCTKAYSKSFQLVDALRYHRIASTLVELLFGFMFLISLQKILQSAGSGTMATFNKLCRDLSGLFSRHDEPSHNLWLTQLSPHSEKLFSALASLYRPVLGDAGSDIAVVWANFAFRSVLNMVLPFKIVVYLIWHIADFASDFLVLLLVAQHALTLWYFLSKIFSTFRTLFKLGSKLFGFLRACFGWTASTERVKDPQGKKDD